jgi:predicted acetyltransferase
MIEFVAPSRELWPSWAESVVEFDGATLHGYGINDESEITRLVTDLDAFDGWAAARAKENAGVDLPAGRVPCTTLWVVEGGRVQGSVSIRHELNDYLLGYGGNIGYGIRPSARRRGLASAALNHGVGFLRDLGVQRVLVGCQDDNVGSRTVIENAGGVLDDVRDGLMRFWIDT